MAKSARRSRRHPIPVSYGVLSGLVALWNSGDCDVLDRDRCIIWLLDHNYYEAMNWLLRHHRLYVEGLMSGFEAR